MAAVGGRRRVLPLTAATRRQGPAALKPHRAVKRIQACAGLLAWLLLAARYGAAAAAAFPSRSTATDSQRPTVAAGDGTTRSSSSRLSEVSAPPEQGQPMTQSALSVLMLASASLIVYFVIRTVRLRRQNRKTRRYGVLDTNIENMELTPLEQDADDGDDTTLFDANIPRRGELIDQIRSNNLQKENRHREKGRCSKKRGTCLPVKVLTLDPEKTASWEE